MKRSSVSEVGTAFSRTMGTALRRYLTTRRASRSDAGRGGGFRGPKRIDVFHARSFYRRQEAADEAHEQGKRQRFDNDPGGQQEAEGELRKRLEIHRGDGEGLQETGKEQ